MTDVNTWSPVDGSNNQAPPDGWPEGMLPAGVNNSARANMGGIARWYERANTPLTTGGTENALTLTYSYIPAPVSGDVFLFLPAYANTGPATLNVGSGALPIRFRDAALRGGELQPHVPAIVVFGGDGYWYLSAPAGGVNGGGDLPLIPSTGTPNAQILTYGAGAPTALVFGDRYTFAAGPPTNTGPTTLNIQGLGAHAVWAGAAPCIGGELLQYAIVDVVWDGTVFQLLNRAVGGLNFSVSGNITAGGSITSAGSVNAASVNAASVVSTGDITADAGTVTGLNVTANAKVEGSFIHSLNNIDATTYVYAPEEGFITRDAATGGANYKMFTNSILSYLQLVPGTTWVYNGVTQDMAWQHVENLFWIMRAADHQCYNQLGPVGGVGSYIVISDVRGKVDIVPSARGLDEILRLIPVSFARTISPERRELGFVAQDVQRVIPEAVRRIGITLPDGSGGLDSADPSLGMTYDTIVACLVTAIKELNARLIALEGGEKP